VRYLLTKIKLLLAVAMVTWKEWAAYRTHVMVSIFVGPVFLLAQVFIWRSLYTGRELLYGLNLDDMIRYFAIVTLLNYLTMDFAGWNLQMLVNSGRFLTFATRPVYHPFFALSQKFGHRLLGVIFELLPVSLIVRFALGVRLFPAFPLWAALSAGLGFLMVFLVNYTIGISAFWMTRTGALRGAFSLFSGVFSGTFIPLVFFPEWLQKLLFFLPFQYMTYVPASVMMGQYRLGGQAAGIPAAVGMQALAVAAMSLVMAATYRLGMRRFTGVGA
jgi:ABC-2 type transport system permease protein